MTTINIIDYIPFYPAEPVTREQLAERTGMSDRALRREIEFARHMLPIVNCSDGRGYYIAIDPKDPNLRNYVRQEDNRVRSIRKSTARARKLISDSGEKKSDQIKGQLNLF